MKKLILATFFTLLVSYTFAQKAPSHLKYFGYYLVDTEIDDPNDASTMTTYTEEVANFSNIAHLHVSNYTDDLTGRVNWMNTNCMKPFISVQNIFWSRKDANGPSGNRFTLLPDYKERWATFKKINASALKGSKVEFFYVSDEPTWNGISYDELNTICNLLKKDFPDIKIMILEAYITLKQFKIPKSADFIGFDRYCVFHPATDTSYLANLATLKSKLSAPHQKIWLTIDDNWIPLYGTYGYTPEMMASVIQEYYDVAAKEPLCEGLVGYMWPGGFDTPEQLGVRNLPKNALDLNVKIGRMIKANNTLCPDTEAPTTPTNCAVSKITQTSCFISWTNSKDNKRVEYYEVYKDGVFAGSTKRSSLTVTGLNCDTKYTITIKATDAVGNMSVASALSVTTPACEVNSSPK